MSLSYFFFLMMLRPPRSTLFPHTTLFLFFFNDTATTEIYTLSLHDALPISLPASTPPAGSEPVVRGKGRPVRSWPAPRPVCSSRAIGSADRYRRAGRYRSADPIDRKSTRLNSSHANISYAVFCLKSKQHHSD